MSSEDSEIYLLSPEEGEDDWVSPTPARSAIVEALARDADLDDDDVDDLEAYVHPNAVREVLESESDTISFEVEGHEVTVDASGEVTVGD